MNDEIREILEYLKDKNDYIEDFGISYKRIHIDNGDLKLLLDYITNLQKEIHKQIHTSIVQKKQINNLQKRNSRQRLANQKQQDLILKLQEEIHKKEAMYDSLAVDYRLAQEENERLLKKSYSDDVRITKAIKLLKKKKEKYKNMTDYHQYYVEGYDKAIELTHSSHSGVMLETIKSTTIKNCDNLLNILQNGSESDE